MTTANKKKQKPESKTDWSKLDGMNDADIDTSDADAAELEDDLWTDAIVGSPVRKKLTSVRFDSDVIEWFKSRGPNYQTRMNQVLRTYMEWCKQRESSSHKK